MFSRFFQLFTATTALGLVSMSSAAPIVLGMDDTDHYVGYFLNGGPELNGADEAARVTHLIGLGIGEWDSDGTTMFQRSNNFSSALPSLGGHSRTPGAGYGGSIHTNNIGYILANYYDLYYLLWYVGRTDTMAEFSLSSPTSFTLFASTEVGPPDNSGTPKDVFSNWSTLNSQRPSFQTAVPDGGLTLMLLGGALGALGLLRRRET